MDNQTATQREQQRKSGDIWIMSMCTIDMSILRKVAMQKIFGDDDEDLLEVADDDEEESMEVPEMSCEKYEVEVGQKEDYRVRQKDEIKMEKTDDEQDGENDDVEVKAELEEKCEGKTKRMKRELINKSEESNEETKYVSRDVDNKIK